MSLVVGHCLLDISLPLRVADDAAAEHALFSHKANLFPTSELLDYEEDTEVSFSPTIRPGE